MNKEWSELNKTVQQQIRKADTFDAGICTLIELRKQLLEQISELPNGLSAEDFSAMPFMNAEGYHNKNIAYSLWHIFRIEDIVAHTLIAGDEQIFFAKDYRKRIGSPIITTGNELYKEQIAEFSKQLDIDELYNYISDVDESTAAMLRAFSFDSVKARISQDKKHQLKELGVVSEAESAVWLIDYWCGKDIRGLIQMPFSRHWIMHTEACLRIKDRIMARKRK